MSTVAAHGFTVALPASSVSVSVIDDSLIQFGFIDAKGNSISVPLTREQADAYVVMLTQFATSAGRLKLRVVLEELP